MDFEHARRIDARLGVDGAFGQTGDGRHDLENRARRELILDGVVDQRLAWIFEQRLILSGGDLLVDVHVVVGHRNHGQHLAAVDVEHHGGSEQRRALVLDQDVLDPLLQLNVDGQDHAQSRRGRAIVQGAQDVADGVDLDQLPPSRAAQLALVGRLDAGASDLIAVEIAGA